MNKDLYIAVASGQLEDVHRLIDAGANVNQAMNDGASPLFPLFFAVQLGHLEIANLLLAENANVNQADEAYGATPLLLAIYAGHLEIVNALLTAGAEVNHADATGLTPLMLAAQEGDVDVVRALFAKGTDVNQAKSDGTTPLIIAAERGHTDIIESLFSKGADYESMRALAENKRWIECELTLRQSWHVFISQKLEDNRDYQDRYRNIESLISKCPVTTEPLYNPLLLVQSGYSIEKSSWEALSSRARELGTSPRCPLTRKVITSACPNYTLKEANEKQWMEIEALYQEMTENTPLAAASNGCTNSSHYGLFSPRKAAFVGVAAVGACYLYNRLRNGSSN